jgi:hypothetical protein
MCGEEGEDPPPGVLGGVVVIARAEQGDELTEHGASVETVEEAVPGARILLDVVGDLEVAQDPLQPRSPPIQGAIRAAIAADDRVAASWGTSP